MLMHDYSYTEDFDFAKLNSFFVENSEKQRAIYEKLKKDNESNRQAFFDKIISQIITKRMSKTIISSSRNIHIESNFIDKKKEKINFQSMQSLYNNEKLFSNIKMKESEMEFPISDSFFV